MSITITPTASGPYWQDAAGNTYVRLDVMRQQMKTQDTIARADRDNAQAALSQARIDASWEKQRGDRYRARALALVQQARDLRFWGCVSAHSLDVMRDRAEKAERERATADKLRLEALQEVERLKAQNRILHDQLAAPYDPWVHKPLSPQDEAVFNRPIPRDKP